MKTDFLRNELFYFRKWQKNNSGCYKLGEMLGYCQT